MHQAQLSRPGGRVALDFNNGVFEADGAGVRRNFRAHELSPASQHARDCHGLFPAARTDQSADDAAKGFGVARALSRAAIATHDAGVPPLRSPGFLLRGGSRHDRTKIAHDFIRREGIQGRLAAFLSRHSHTGQ